jgi:hypothetical protein
MNHRACPFLNCILHFFGAPGEAWLILLAERS